MKKVAKFAAVALVLAGLLAPAAIVQATNCDLVICGAYCEYIPGFGYDCFCDYPLTCGCSYRVMGCEGACPHACCTGFALF